MTERPPVRDWATDFDHLDPEFVADPYPIYDQLREQCPIAHTDRYHGVWIPTRYDDLAAIAHDHHRFSSRTILITDRPESPTDLGFHAPPITEDPPYHTDIRRVLLPLFSPAVVAAYEPITRVISSELIDRFVGDDICDAATAYAQHVPDQGHPGCSESRQRPRAISRLDPLPPLKSNRAPSPATAPTTPSSRSRWLPRQPIEQHRQAATPTTSSPHLLDARLADGRTFARRRDPRRLHPPAPRRHRHDVVRHRIGLVELPGFRRHVVVTDQAARLAA
ncbi:MAG: hypothetical protein M5T61_09700 [Acidimicrobiia bacterium]|nr:hypothetical protein [Acidimicrobiia bacterium]